MDIEEIDLTEQDIRERMKALSEHAGMSVEDAYLALDRGEFEGTILESKLSGLRFLLEAFEPMAAE